MTNLNLSQILQFVNVPKADWIGLREVREKLTLRSVRNGKPEQNQHSLTHGIMVEVLSDGQFGYAATARTDLQGVQKAAARAYQLAQAASAYKLFSFTTEQRPAVTGTYHSKAELRHLPTRELIATLEQTCAHLRVSDQIIETSASAVIGEVDSHFVSSNGSDTHQNFFYVTSDMAAVAQKGALVQRRTNNGWSTHSYQTGLELFTSEALRERAVTIGSQALELLEADECPAETMSLVLAPDQMYIQIHESIGHPLELDRILGDERNYAGSSFVKLSDFGSLVYGSPLMNIVFDPTQAGQFSCYAFDDIGNTAKRESLIENGILKRGLGSLESQIRSGVKGVANQRASQWNRAPIDRIANINMQPGQSPRDEVIGSVERGIYMESNRSWSIDDYRHKFQFGCEYGKLIEDGRLTRTVRNPAYRSTTPHFWRNLSRVGNAQTFEVYGAPHCGKGEPNQMIRHGHAAPLCRFDHIEVFGGGQ